MRHLLVALALTLAVTDARAQAVLGTYATTGEGSAGVTLVLRNEGPGRIGGSLSGNGVTYAVEGEMQGEDVKGSFSGSGMKTYFEAHRDGSQLRVIMADIGSNGTPNYAAAHEILFTVRGGVTQAGEVAALSVHRSVRGGRKIREPHDWGVHLHAGARRGHRHLESTRGRECVADGRSRTGRGAPRGCDRADGAAGPPAS